MSRLLVRLAVLAAVLAPVPAWGQIPLSGTVVDSAGSPIGTAVVNIAELGRAALTDSHGSFDFGTLPSGTYTVGVRRVGYLTVARQITLNVPMTLTFRLSVTPFQVEPVTVTATRLPTTTLRSPLPTSALSEDELRREASVSLAKSLTRLAGVRSVSTGEQIGKPMIRGLFGSRVLVLENGSRLEDYSWSDEDAPSVDARLAQRVEVIRGPASVLYGSDAVGGVVNVVPEDLPSANGGRGFTDVGIEAYGATNNKEVGSTIKISGANGKLGWRLFGVGRWAESYSTPDGEVENTGFLSGNGEVAVGIRGNRGNNTLRFSHYGGEFKLLEANGPPPGVQEGEEEGPERKLADDRLQLNSDYLFGKFRLETKAQWQRHSLQEVSDDACRLIPTLPTCTGNTANAPKEQPAFDLLLNTGTLDLLGHHTIGEEIRGTIGVTGLYQTNDSHGPLFLVPDATTSSIGAFLFEEFTRGPLSLLAGGRVDARHLSADANPAIGLSADDSRDWTVSSGNLGAVFRPIESVALAGNFGLAWRAPTLFELYSNGPLLAEGRYVIGDHALSAEKAKNFDASVRWEGSRFRGEIAGFRNHIDDFVYLTPTTQTLQSLRVFQYKQADAVLTGGELSGEAVVVPGVTVKARHDFVRGTNEDLDQPLPLIAPPRTAGGIDFKTSPTWANSFFVGGEVEHVAEQTRPNPNDFVTDAYTLLNFDAGVEKNLFGRSMRFELGVRNAADVRYRSFLSRYKEFSLEPGRNIILRISTDR